MTVRVIPSLMLACGLATLAGCATQANKLDRSLKATLAQPLVQDSILREGDLLSFQLPVPQSNHTVLASVQFEAACSSAQLNLLYLDGARRVYPKGPGRYSSAHALSADLYAALAANPSFVQACSSTPKADWRLVKTDDRDQWVLIDRNSLSSHDGQTRFWAAFDNPTVLNDLPYNAPYAQKREHFAVSCSSGTYQLLAGYDLDARNRVSDGRVDPDATAQPIKGSNADYASLFALVCSEPAKLAQLEAFKPRLKAPVKIALQSVHPQVLKAITQLQLAQPSQALTFVRTAGTSTYQGKTKPSGEDQFISNDGPSGQLTITTRGEGYESQEVNWRGLIPLVSKSSFDGGAGMAESSALSQLSFSGDWQHLPVGDTVSYTYSRSTLNSIVGTYGDPAKAVRCTVERELPASELNRSLAGTAKALACKGEPDKYQRTDHLYYLVDYGYFFKASTDKNSFFYSDYRIDSVR